MCKASNGCFNKKPQWTEKNNVLKLEYAWRGLKFVIDRTNFRENIKIELLNVSKENLLDDFEDAPEVVKSGLYKQISTEAQILWYIDWSPSHIGSQNTSIP